MSPGKVGFRAVVTGTESTGKSTLTAELSAFFGCSFSQEAARLYVEDHRRPLTVDDVEPIAMASAEELVLHDTDLWSTVIYADHYYRFRSERLLSNARQLSADLYLLCDIDLPWVAEPFFRDQGKPKERGDLHNRFVDLLDREQLSWRLIRGTGESRTQSAIEALTMALRQRAHAR
jgi:nicotinamide riboside kinase